MYKFVVLLLVVLVSAEAKVAGWDIYRKMKIEPRFNDASDADADNRINSMNTLDCKYDICTYVENYPANQIDQAMDSHHTAQTLLGDIFDSSAFSLEDRVNFDEATYSQLCSTEGFVTYKPQGLRNLKNEWKFIVNTEKYKQTFTVEICRDLATGTSGQCRNNGSDCSYLGYTCMQSYQDISLLIYDEDRVRFDKFTIPTTCKCCADERCRHD